MSDESRQPDEEIGLSLEQIELGERVVRQLEGVGERRRIRLGRVSIVGKRRRPSGEKAPLPRQLKASGRLWLAIGLVAVAIWISLFAWPGTTEWWTDRDHTVLGFFSDLRTDVATTFAKVVNGLGSIWLWRPMRWALVGVLIFYKRWRHLLGIAVAILTVETLVAWVANEIARPRPFVEIIGSWSGYSHPSAPVASLSITLGVIGFAALPKGRRRNRWMTAAGVLVALLVVARVYLGLDHLTDGVIGALFGIAVAVVVFRLLVPDSVFPVSYRRGVTAHLDVGGERGAAISQAIADQLGWQVTSLEHFGLKGSGGSTPLRIEVAGGPADVVFAKLYAANHLRADRWYKLGRTILYGSLENEVRFTSVRRLVEYEDYMLLTMRKAGIPSPEPYGIIEITPEREYLIVTEFLQDAAELGDVEVTLDIIDQSLRTVRELWDAGLAHRDIKPSNIMVREGRVRLIDVAFGTVRPTPWRQAVDLANMMLVLGVACGPELVYQRALAYFAPEDIAEAFAATKAITLPSQLSTSVKSRQGEDQVDLIERFRELAPSAEPISIQRFSLRRLGVTAGAVAVVVVLLALFIENLTRGGLV